MTKPKKRCKPYKPRNTRRPKLIIDFNPFTDEAVRALIDGWLVPEMVDAALEKLGLKEDSERLFDRFREPE